MPDHVFDTGILIRHLRDLPGYPELLNRLTDEGQIYISAFTHLEVVRGMREHERQKTLDLLSSVYTVPVDAIIADQAGEFIRAWRKQGINLGDADAVIAATAITLEMPLVTTNPRHFPMPELVIWQADDAGNLSLVAL